MFKNQTAVAIETVNNNNKVTVIFSEIEIILAAGAVNTPKLLFLSGIGHISELQRLNIPKVVHLPGVGLNLYDHINFPLYATIEAPISVTIRKLGSFTEVANYLLHKTGNRYHIYKYKVNFNSFYFWRFVE